MTTPTKTTHRAELLELRHLVARLEAENATMSRELTDLRVEAKLRAALRNEYGILTDAEADAITVPPRFTTALRFGVRDATVIVRARGLDVCVVLAKVSNSLNRCREAWVWERLEAVVEEVATHPAAAADMVRMDLPDEIGALTWRRDGHPVVVISTATRRPALRQALRVAGHTLVTEGGGWTA